MSATTDDLVTEAEARHTRTTEDELPGDAAERSACVLLTCIVTSDVVEE